MDLEARFTGPVQALPPAPPPWWRQLLTFLHLPGGIMAPQAPTITSCKFTGTGAPGPYPPGATAQITVVAQSANTSSTAWAVPVQVTDETADLSGTGTATGTIEAFNALAASISDPSGHEWTVVSASQTGPGVFTGVLETTV